MSVAGTGQWSEAKKLNSNNDTKQFGKNIVESSDGNLTIVGSPNTNGNIGSVSIFLNSDSTNNPIVITPQSTGTDSFIGKPQFGSAIALSNDNSTLAISGVTDNAVGAVWIYSNFAPLYNGKWIEEQKITSSTANTFGTAISFTPDGTELLIGDPFASGSDGSRQGIIYLYSNTSGILGTWNQLKTLSPPSGFSGVVLYGSIITVSGDGLTFVTNGVAANTIWSYTRSSTDLSSTWNLDSGSITTISEASINASISRDGNTLAIGSSFPHSHINQALIYTRVSGNWSLTQTINEPTDGLPVNSSISTFGFSIKISPDTSLLLIGGIFDNTGVGAVWVYTNSGSGTTYTEFQKIVPTDLAGSTGVGYSVAIDSVNNRLIFSAFDPTFNNPGAVWIYSQSTPSNTPSSAISTNFEIRLVANDLYNTGLFSGINTNTKQGDHYVYKFAELLSQDLILKEKMQYIAGSYLNLY
jgi:hypothetical protein